MQQFHSVIEPDPFHVQYHLSLIPCDKVSLVFYTSFWFPSQLMGYDEGLQWKLKTLI